ncbi:UvrD-helicase domain-containing protein [Salinibacter altiplanensis]|uniref:UvrD-helicase domain-containing protein n=1 Tax=Salinibacter altiplanensis TaxID=1803181 RepID=UPI000C9FFB0E|nr:UvrD-helicase domain-containing protein [Salinibacter altiplanensis]
MSAPSSVSSTYDDAAVRRRIGPWRDDDVPSLSAFEPDTNFFVRAAAGSGKTTALVARMVALVRSGVSVEDLTAITFTRKAAGEMSQRFYEELRRAQAALPAESAQRRRVTAALQDAQQAFIGTIHSFCARLLRERPIAANLPPGFVAGLDDREERELRDRAWQDYLQAVRADRPARREVLTGLGVEPEDLDAYFERLCEHPELKPYINAPDTVPSLEQAAATVQARLREWQAHRPDTLPEGRDDAMQALDTAEKLIAQTNLETPAQRAELLELMADVSDEESADVTLKCWRGPETDAYDWARTLRDEKLPVLVRDVVQPALRRWRACVHKEVVEFVRPAVDRFASLRRREGRLTFHDLLACTRDLLRDHPRLRTTIQKRHPRLLVDEFQDTDPLQAELLFYLTSRTPTETTWTDCRPRPGSLFIVGDDKQSIYRFRRADMEVFEAVGERIEETGGEAVTLTKNFRSLDVICDWCDEAFERIFDDPGLTDLQATYTPFDPQRTTGRDVEGVRRISLEKVRGNWGTDIARQDAERIARFIRGARDGSGALDARFLEGDTADYSDFLVLTRTKSRLSVYAEALAERSIPYTVTGSEDLGEAAELKALVDLLTCALRPDDEVACVAYLKGPLVGASDDDLYRFSQAGGRFDCMHEPVPRAVGEALPATTARRFEEAFDRLREARRLVRGHRPGVAVEQIIDDLGLLAGAAHPPDPSEGSLRAGRVLRTITYVQDLAARGLGWAEVLEELQRVVDGDEDVDGMTLETGGGDAVRVMNVHQAKGLEAPVVFLADPYSRGSGPSVRRHLRRRAGELVAPIVQGSGYRERVTHPPLGWETAANGQAESFCESEERHEAAEGRRLLYVAATRARNLLVVSTYPEKPKEGPWAPLYEHLDAAEVPELEMPEGEPPSDRSDAPAPALEARRAERESRIEEQSRPAYRTESVTEGEHGPAMRPTGEDGYGEAFGAALHQLLEQCVRTGRPAPWTDRAVVATVLERAGAATTPDVIQRATTMVQRFLDGRIWARLQEANRLYSEYPIAHAVQEETPVVRRGVIDLAWRRDGQWTLVDYKTDRVQGAPPEALPPDHPYAQQLRAYAEAWAAVVDEPVARGGLWLADAGVGLFGDPLGRGSPFSPTRRSVE